MAIDEKTKKAAKSDRNRRAYLKSKKECDVVLLRLDPGGRTALDEASRAAGLSRAAFARIYLIPLVEVLTERAPEIDAARRATGQSLATFLARSLDQAIAPGVAMDAQSADMLAQEFHELFGAK